MTLFLELRKSLVPLQYKLIDKALCQHASHCFDVCALPNFISPLILTQMSFNDALSFMHSRLLKGMISPRYFSLSLLLHYYLAPPAIIHFHSVLIYLGKIMQCLYPDTHHDTYHLHHNRYLASKQCIRCHANHM